MNETQKHTPGPWHASGISMNRIVGDENAAADKIHISGGNRTIARVYRAADATPIKAAPDLIDACEVMLACLESLTTEDYGKGGDREARIALHAAVAKARGGAR